MEAERKDMTSRETGGVDMRGIRERIEAIEAIEAGKKREEAERQAALLKRSKRSFRNSIIASVHLGGFQHRYGQRVHQQKDHRYGDKRSSTIRL